MKTPKPTTKKLIPGPRSNQMNKSLEQPRVVKPTGPVKKTSRPGTADKQTTKQGGKVTITGSATGSKSLTAAQVAKMNKMTSKYKFGNR